MSSHAALPTCSSFLEDLQFTEEALDYLAGLGAFSQQFLDYLAAFRFTGDVYALPEGTVAFSVGAVDRGGSPAAAGAVGRDASHQPSSLSNSHGLQSRARVCGAARGATVVDFGSRRAHGTDSAIKGARAFHVAGISATSNVLAGKTYGIPVRGTMAHSYIQAHDDEFGCLAAVSRRSIRTRSCWWTPTIRWRV